MCRLNKKIQFPYNELHVIKSSIMIRKYKCATQEELNGSAAAKYIKYLPATEDIA